jgi:NADH-quinone oxidoreductase subunit G
MGCNITVEWDKSRPHQDKKARVMRLKPRLNPDVNDYWMCDVGRYDYHHIDENRIFSPQFKDDLISWNDAIEKIAQVIKPLRDTNVARIGVLPSAKLTNEDLFAVRKLFKDTLKVSNLDFRLPGSAGPADDFLLKADRNPNTAGALAILSSDGNAQDIIQKARQGQLDVLYVFGHDLVKQYGKEAVIEIEKNVKLFIYQGSNINETCSYAHIILPSASYAEKDGTFTNVQQRVQRIWPAFKPIGESKSDWEIVSFLAEKLGAPLAYKRSADVFKDIAGNVGSFAGMTYETIGDQGMVLKK